MSERQVTPKTWDEVVEIAAEAAFEQLSAGRAWDSASAMEREERRIEANAALHALRADGLAVVDEEVLATIRDWCGEGTEDFADTESVHIRIGRRVTIYLTLGELRALSAGEIAPPDKGEG